MAEQKSRFAQQANGNDQPKSRFARQKRNYAPPKREMNVFEAVPVALAAGGSFGQRPKILATGSALKAIPDAIQQRSFAPIAEGYRQGFDFFVDEQDRAREKLGLAGIAVGSLGHSVVTDLAGFGRSLDCFYFDSTRRLGRMGFWPKCH